MSLQPTLALVTALRWEAQPLIDHFNLKPGKPETPFPIYERDHIKLIITGMGKMAAASGCTYLQHYCGESPPQAWINIGIAGKGDSPVGKAFFAHKVSDAGNGKAWYPPCDSSLNIPSAECVTVEKIEEDFSKSVLYEMEASGILTAICRYCPIDLMRFYKVVSDGQEPKDVSEWLNKDFIQTLLSSHLGAVEVLMKELTEQSLSLNEAPPEHPSTKLILERWRFSHSQGLHLRSLLSRWQILGVESGPLDHCEDCKDAKAVLHELESAVQGQSLLF